MKRILAIILAALMLCCVFVACDTGSENPSETTKADKTEATTKEETTKKETTEEPTTEEPTTDDGQPDLIESYVDVWDDMNESHNPHPLTGDKSIGIAITIPEGGCLYEAAVQAPSYSDNIGNLTIKIFAWNTDYATTVAAEPVYAETFVDFVDNSSLTCEFEEGQIPGGRYLILVCDPVDESGSGVGVWAGKPYKAADLPEEYAKYSIEAWADGKLNKKTIAKFSLIIMEYEEQ